MSTITTKHGKYEISGFTAGFLGLARKIAVPLAFIFGLYGIAAGIAMGKDVLWIAGIVVIFTGWLLKTYIDSIFEHFGKPLD